MKRCPQCNRVESDEALRFCRFDGATLVSDSASIDQEAGTVKLGSGSVANESAAGILPQTTDANINRVTAPTRYLVTPTTVTTGALAPRKRRRIAIATAVIVTAIAAALIVVMVNSYLSTKRRQSIQSIAVMPFVNESGNSEVEYVSDGMTETLITNLSQIPNLSVKARSTVFYYKGKEASPKRIGEELGVQAVLLGRVVQRGPDLKLSLELVNTQTQNVIWSEQYNRKISDLLTVQSEISRDISEQLRSKLTTEQGRVTRNYTANPEAYQLYLKGRFYWNKQTEDGLQKAVDYFNQAIAKDPNYAQAYAELATSYVWLAVTAEDFARARGAATRALTIDDKLAEAHTSLALIKQQFDWDFAGAETEYRRAVELNPNYAVGHDLLGMFLAAMGRFDEASREVKRALELDPLSLVINKHLATCYLFSRQYDQALDQLKRTLDLDPSFVMTHVDFGWAYEKKGMYEQSVTSYKRALELEPNNAFALAGLGYAYAVSGKTDDARKILNQLKELSKRSEAPAFYVAIVYAGLGDKDEAFVWLEKCYQARTDLSDIKVDPMFETLRPDPRFADLVRRVGLPQ